MWFQLFDTIHVQITDVQGITTLASGNNSIFLMLSGEKYVIFFLSNACLWYDPQYGKNPNVFINVNIFT
jgi:hypothetical protein